MSATAGEGGGADGGGGHRALTISAADGALEATFLPAIGMVCCSLRHYGEELLAQRGGPEAYASKASTFGIPLLHPWANRLSAWEYSGGPTGMVQLDRDSPVLHADASTGLPIHGVLAASPDWRVGQGADGETVDRFVARLRFTRPECLAAFPFPHTLAYSAQIAGNSLRIALTLEATGAVAVPVSFGFHPYLTLPGSDRREWLIELPVARRAELDAKQIPTGITDPIVPGTLDGPLGDRTFDTSFPELHDAPGAPATFVVADQRRRIELELTQGYPVAQVFAPDASDFICFEPMTAPVDALCSGEGLRAVAPGDEFTAIFTISVR